MPCLHDLPRWHLQAGAQRAVLLAWGVEEKRYKMFTQARRPVWRAGSRLENSLWGRGRTSLQGAGHGRALCGCSAPSSQGPEPGPHSAARAGQIQRRRGAVRGCGTKLRKAPVINHLSETQNQVWWNAEALSFSCRQRERIAHDTNTFYELSAKAVSCSQSLAKRLQCTRHL